MQLLLLYEVYEILAENNLNSNLADGQISFSVVDGEPYVKVGADSPRPFNSTYSHVDLLTASNFGGTSLDISAYSDKKSFIIMTIGEASSAPNVAGTTIIQSITGANFENIFQEKTWQWGTNIYSAFSAYKVEPYSDSLILNYSTAGRTRVFIIY